MLCTNIYCHVLHFGKCLCCLLMKSCLFFIVNDSGIFLFQVLFQIVNRQFTHILQNCCQTIINQSVKCSRKITGVRQNVSDLDLDMRRIETHYLQLFIFSPCIQWTLWHRRECSQSRCTKETFPLDVIACFCSFFHHNDVFLS